MTFYYAAAIVVLSVLFVVQSVRLRSRDRAIVAIHRSWSAAKTTIALYEDRIHSLQVALGIRTGDIVPESFDAADRPARFADGSTTPAARSHHPHGR